MVNSIIRNCNQAYSTIGLAAPTHKAGRILKENISISNIKLWEEACLTVLGFFFSNFLCPVASSHPPSPPTPQTNPLHSKGFVCHLKARSIVAGRVSKNLLIIHSQRKSHFPSFRGSVNRALKAMLTWIEFRKKNSIP